MYIFSLHCYTRTSSSLTYTHTRSILSHMQRGNHITMSFDLLVWIVVLPKIFVTFEVSSYSLKIVFSLFSFCRRSSNCLISEKTNFDLSTISKKNKHISVGINLLYLAGLCQLNFFLLWAGQADTMPKKGLAKQSHRFL